MLEVRALSPAATLTPYLYASRRASVLWLAVAVIATAVVVWRVAPETWRPRNRLVPVVACAAAYLSLTTGFETGFNQWLDHDVFERLRGGVDDIATWLVGAAGAFVTLALASILGGGRRDR